MPALASLDKSLWRAMYSIRKDAQQCTHRLRRSDCNARVDVSTLLDDEAPQPLEMIVQRFSTVRLGAALQILEALDLGGTHRRRQLVCKERQAARRERWCGGAAQGGFNQISRKPSSRAVDVSGGIMLHLGRRLVDATASGPVRARRTRAVQEHPAWRRLLAMPNDHMDQTAGSICGQLAHAAHAKKRSPIHSLCWSSEGRRLVTGNRDGEFTLWRGTDFAPPELEPTASLMSTPSTAS